jgi:hypothetical protein
VKEGNLIVRRIEDDSIVKKVHISHPNLRKVEKQFEKIKKHFNEEVFYIDDSDFHLLYIEEGKLHE